MNKKGLSLPFESRRISWVVAGTVGGGYPELTSEEMGSSMSVDTHRQKDTGAQGGPAENCHEPAVSKGNTDMG